MQHPTLQALVNQANNLFGLPIIQRNQAYAYLVAKSTGSMPLDAASLRALVTNFADYNDDIHLNIQIYQLMQNLGLGTDLRSFLNSTVIPNWVTRPSGGVPIQNGQDVPNIIKYARLRQLGAI